LYFQLLAGAFELIITEKAQSRIEGSDFRQRTFTQSLLYFVLLLSVLELIILASFEIVASE
jgi:hypothetical protein